MQILRGYRRKSVVRDATDLVSPEQQAHACELWASLHLPDVHIEWYEDIDRSARNEKGRPGWLALMNDLTQPDTAGVIAYSFDRMYRNVYQFLKFLNRLEQLNLRLIVVRESLDTSTSIGRAIVTILMAIAQLESDQTSERMTTAVKYRREVQGRHWGPTPWGCDRNEQGHIIPSERSYWLDTATGEAYAVVTPNCQEKRYYDALSAAYSQFVTGHHSYDSLAETLNAAGWRFMDRHGQPRLIDRDDVRRALAYWRLFRGDLPTGKIQRKNAPILEGGHGPVLPVELCDRVGQVLAGREKRFRRRNLPGSRVYLLSSVLYCGVCGKKMKGVIDHGLVIYRHYGAKGNCPERWVNAEEAEEQVIVLLSKLSDPGFLGEIRAEAESMAREIFDAPDNRELAADLEKQRGRLDRLEELYLDGDIDRDRYRRRKGEIVEAIGEIEKRLYGRKPALGILETMDKFTETLEEIKKGDPAAQKNFINALFERLEIVGGEVRFSAPRPWAREIFGLAISSYMG